MPQKRLTTNGNVFRRTDGRWQSVIWYFDEQGEKKRKTFSSKTKTEAQQKITTYIAQFNEEVRNSDESQKTLKDSLTRWLQVFKFPSVERTTYDHSEESPHSAQRVFPLPHGRRFHPEESYAKRAHDEEGKFSGSTGQGVCVGAGSCHGVHAHRNRQVQAGSFLYFLQR